MRTFRFDKLVRDKIPGSIRQAGETVRQRTLNEAEYLEALKAKLLEETNEVSFNDKAEALQELADLQEVIDCMCRALGADKARLQALQQAKNTQAGSFETRTYIETVEVQANSPWIKYYEQNPEKFPEIRSV